MIRRAAKAECFRHAAARWLESLGRQTLDLLFPPRCALCEVSLELSPDEPSLCQACRSALLVGSPWRCPRCGGDAAQQVLPGERCSRCRSSKFHFARTVALGVYHTALKEAVLAMKHAHRYPVAVAMAELLWTARGSELGGLAADVLVPVPMHWRRRLMQGANSPETVAEVLGRKLQRPVWRRLLRRADRPPQGSLSAYKRRRNLRGAMSLRRRRGLDGLRVLLVDDVLTTGATCNEAARVLKKAGAAEVVVCVVARGIGED